VFGSNQPEPTSVPASDTGAIVTSTHAAPPPATTTTTETTTETTTTVPVTTVAPVTTTAPHTTVKAVVVAPRTTVQHVVHHPVHHTVTHQTTVHRAPTTTEAPPAIPAGRYHAGEFCKTLGSTAISSTGAAMTCIQEGDYKRWHND
jgi:hypothetical protein